MAEKKEETKGGCLGCLVIIVALFLLIGGCTMIFGDDEEKEKEEAPKEKVEKTSEKTKRNIQDVKGPLTEEEYQGVVKNYAMQIQLAGEDLAKLSNEMNDSGRTTNKGKDLIYAIYGSLDGADLILKGVNNNITPPAKYEQDHASLLEANSHFQNASESLKSFEESENTDDLNNALNELVEGTEIADISVRNVTDN